jgi:hypothetical protein
MERWSDGVLENRRPNAYLQELTTPNHRISMKRDTFTEK